MRRDVDKIPQVKSEFSGIHCMSLNPKFSWFWPCINEFDFFRSNESSFTVRSFLDSFFDQKDKIEETVKFWPVKTSEKKTKEIHLAIKIMAKLRLLDASSPNGHPTDKNERGVSQKSRGDPNSSRMVFKVVRVDFEDVHPSSFQSLWWRSHLRNNFFFPTMGPIIAFWTLCFHTRPRLVFPFVWPPNRRNFL